MPNYGIYFQETREIILFKKRIFAFLPIFFLLAGCGSSDDSLIAYQFQGNAVPALDKVLTSETGGTYITSLSPAEGGGEITEPVATEEDDGSSSEETEPSEDVPAENYISYDYQMFNKDMAAVAVKDYVKLMTNDEYAFELDSEEPDYSSTVGNVVLKRPAVLLDENGEATPSADLEEKTDEEKEAEEKAQKEAEKNMTKEEKKAAKEKQKQLEKELEVLPPYSNFEHDSKSNLLVDINWTPTSCLVTLKIKTIQSSDNGSEPSAVISFTGAKMLMNSVVPAELGLPGEDMTEYTLMPGPGYVMVDEVPCLAVYVYKNSAQHTNELATICFVSADGSTLYQQEKVGDTHVKKIELGDIPDPLPNEGDELLEMALEAEK